MFPISTPLSVQSPVNPTLRAYEIAVLSHQKQQHRPLYIPPSSPFDKQHVHCNFHGTACKAEIQLAAWGLPLDSGALSAKDGANPLLLHLSIKNLQTLPLIAIPFLSAPRAEIASMAPYHHSLLLVLVAGTLGIHTMPFRTPSQTLGIS